MFAFTLKRVVASMLAVLIIFCGQASFAQAALNSNEQVDTQKKEVLVAVVNTLEQHLKFLQMIFIQRLETRVTHLQALLDDQ